MQWIVGSLLVAAAVLKAAQYVFDPVTTSAGIVLSYLWPFSFAAELALGLLALTGIYWRQLRWLALFLFASFAVYSLNLALGGAISCGCFGPVKFNPWWTFLLDVAVVLGLAVSIWLDAKNPDIVGTKMKFKAPSINVSVLSSAIVGVSVICAAMLVRYADTRAAAAKGLPTSSGELVILEPEKWVGDKLPIAGFIDIDVSKGNWIVVLHRHDCSECQEAVPKYEQLAATLDDIKLAFVEVPPFGDRNSLDDPHWHHGHLKADVEWFVQTPVEIQVRDGVVKNASIQLPTLTEFGVR